MVSHVSKLRGVLLVAMLLLLLGCKPANFKVEFRLPADYGATVRLLYYAADKRSGRIMETAVALHEDKGTLECPAILPAVVYVLSPSGQPVLAFYAERGDKFTVTSEESDPLTWEIKGNRISEEWSEWRVGNIESLRTHDPMRINTAVAGYVKEHPTSRLSTLLLLTTYDRRINPSGFSSLWKLLKDDALDPDLIALVSRSDQLGSSLPAAPVLRSFVIRTTNGTDTLRPGAPALLYFWHSGESRRSEGIEVIRRLSSELSDSSSRILADICLDSDSVAWYMPLAADSLRHTLRGWLPAGEADTSAMNLGVERSPLFVVADKKGRISYRGELPAEAEAEFRKIMK